MKNIFAIVFGIILSSQLFAQSPGGVSSGLQVWFKANTGTSTTTNGATVSQWNDQAPYNKDATLTGGSDLPTYTSSKYNFNPAVYFPNGDNGYFEFDFDSIKGTDYTLIGVIERDNSNSHSYIIGTHMNATNQGLHFGYRNNSKLTLAQWGNDINVNTTDYDAPQALTVIRGELNTSTGKTVMETRDGVTVSNSHGNTPSLTGTGIGTLGRAFPGGFEGYIAETFAYDRNLTSTEFDQVYSYIGMKYGITLDQDYLASDGSTIWDKSANTGYLSNIIGIGRDDDSGLSQTKSQSINSASALLMDNGGSFGTDKTFVVAGTNNQNNIATSNVPAGYQNIGNRVWKINETGNVSGVTLKFNLLEMGVPNSNIASDYALIKDTDTDFTSGATLITSGITFSGDSIIFSGVDVEDGFIAIATKIEITAPGGVFSNLRVWLKADAGTSTTTDGAALASWADQSGYNNGATQAGSSDFATYEANQFNYNPAVHFSNGDNGYFNIDLDDIKNTDYTLISIVERDNNNSSSYILGTNAAVNNQGLHFGYRGNQNATIGHWGNNLDLSVTGYDNPQAISIIRAEFDDGSGKKMFETKNEVLSSSSHSNTNALTGTAQGQLGRAYSGGFEGHCAEVIAYSSLLNDGEVDKIYSYLGMKYGLTLPQDYISSDGTVLWNNASNMSYHHNITAIGRDDDAGLSQTQSKSLHDGSDIEISTASAFSNSTFLIIGSNQSTLTNTTNLPGGYNSVTNRIWRSEVTGSVSNATIKITMPSVGMPNTGIASHYALLLDTDTDFTSGATIHTSGISVSNDTLIITGVSISDGYFAIASSAEFFGPGGVTDNLKLWLRADTGSSTTTNGATIAQWSDISGFNNHATQAGSSDYATYTTDKYNHNPAVYFSNGDNGYFDVNLDDIKGTDYTLISIVERDDDNTFSFIAGTNSNQSHRGLQFGYRNNQNATIGHWGNDISVSVNKYDEPQDLSVLRAELNTASGKSIFETRGGTQTTSSHANTNTLTGTANGLIGKAYPGGFEGYCAEVIAYSSTLSATDIERIYTYLGVKYSFVSNFNYIANDGTIIWNTSSNSSYHNSVAGIGRNDDSKLLQSKSTDRASDLALTVEAQSTLDNDEYLIWGSTNKGTAFNDNVPSSLTSNLTNIWKFEERGETGNLNISIDVSGIANLPTGANDFVLLVDTDTNFSNATSYTANSFSSDVATFNNINLTDGNYVTLGIWKSITWNGASYDNGSGTNNAPNMTDLYRKFYVNGSNATINEHGHVLSMEVANGASLTINGGNALSITNSIVNNGSVTIENTGGIIQIHEGSNNNSGSGNYTVKRTGDTNPLIYDAWGSPTQNQDLLGASGVFDGANPCDIFTFMGDIQAWRYDYTNGFNAVCQGNNVTFGSGLVMNGGDGVMNTGRGYFVPGSASPTREFEGQINNGTVSTAVSAGPNPGANWTGDNWNLVSNPYPSAIDASTFISANNATITSNLYFWDQTIVGGHVESVYIVWNAAGSVNQNAGSAQMLGQIGSGQGFYVEVKNDGNVTFDNSMRHNSNGTFFKTDNTDIERIYLSALDGVGRKIQQLITFKGDATWGHDELYDAKYLAGNQEHHFYSILDSTRMVIQSFPLLPMDDIATIPLGISCDAAGKFRFLLEDKENITGTIYLFDRYQNKTYNLEQEVPEVYLAQAGTYNDRFFLKYHKHNDDDTTTNIEENDTDNGILFINSDVEYRLESKDNSPIGTVELFDVLGRTIFSTQVSRPTFYIPGIDQKILLVRITRPDGKVISKKLAGR